VFFGESESGGVGQAIAELGVVYEFSESVNLLECDSTFYMKIWKNESSRKSESRKF